LALIELCDNLYSHLDQHEVVVVMYFDLQKAFDTVDHKIFLEQGQHPLTGQRAANFRLLAN